MSATMNLHGPHAATARVIGPGEFTQEPFVNIEISAPGISVHLMNLDAAGLEALSAAVGTARVLLGSITAPPPLVWCDLVNAPAHWAEHQQQANCRHPQRVTAASLPPEPDPDDAEAQRIAEVFADARAEQDRGL